MTVTVNQALARLQRIHHHAENRDWVDLADVFQVLPRTSPLRAFLGAKTISRTERQAVIPAFLIMEHEGLERARMARLISQGPPSTVLKHVPKEWRELMEDRFETKDPTEVHPPDVIAMFAELEAAIPTWTGPPEDNELPTVEVCGKRLILTHGHHRALWAWLYEEKLEVLFRYHPNDPRI